MKKMVLVAFILVFLVVPLLFMAFVYGMYVRNDYVGVETDFSASAYLDAPPAPFNEPLTLKIVTFNIQDLWVVGRNRPARMRHIGRVLAELDPDVVGFQESFIEKDREILIDALADTRLRYHEYYPSATVGSGLLISSAWPIRETFFMRYSQSGAAHRVWEGDFWAGKGVALARIETPAGMMDVYNTHAQAGYGRPSYRVLRVSQMEELAAFMNESRMGTVPAFLVGDMNCRIGSNDYETAVTNANLKRVMTIDSRIDHIFAAQNDAYEFQTLDTTRIWEKITEDGRTFNLSDHAGYMSVVRITPVGQESEDASETDVAATETQ